MSVKINTIAELKEYFMRVIERANHHAPNVSKITYTLLGLIILNKDDNHEIEVRGSKGAIGNILWMYINNNRYAFRYQHEDDTIEIRKDSYQGNLVIKIDNNSSTDSLIDEFNKM